MTFAFLLLGLFPIMFMSDLFSGESDDPDSETEDDDAVHGAQGGGTFLPLGAEDEPEGDGDILSPITDDEEPVIGDEVDPDEVLKPVEDDEEPVVGDEVDPDTVLDPVDEPGDDAPAPGDASLLQSRLAAGSDFDTGSGWLGKYGPETDETVLDGDGAHLEPDDGEIQTGQGALGDRDGTPVLTGASTVKVIAGGDGDDEITLGDAPAYAFGGAGDDTIAGGEGAAAIFGGDGDDTLTASDTGAGTWIDGGDGNDTIIGGAASETLLGGAHGAGDDSVQDDDTIVGGGGDDIIAGGYGADTLVGGDGDDVIDHLGRAEQDISAPHHAFAWHIDNDADALFGGDGNDTLIMDRADNATGGTGNDTFWVYFDDASGSGAADVGDFTVGEDFLRITLNPELDHGDMVLRVEPSDDGADGIVRVNDAIVAILRGAANATEADMLVEVTENIFG